MVKFAKECLQKIREVTHELEVTLGPDTGELSARFGTILIALAMFFIFSYDVHSSVVLSSM